MKRARDESGTHGAETVEPYLSKRIAPSTLSSEISAFQAHAACSEEESTRRQHALALLKTCTTAVWPQSSNLVFGSSPVGLDLPGADLDVAVQGAVTNAE